MLIRIYVVESMAYRTAFLLDMALEGIDPTKADAGVKTGEAIRKYALECSINKVFGTEMLDFVVDECVQIFGGYGYIQDYPAEGAYRDSRINRIWEGTNEINRMLIVDTLMRAAMKGELPLLQVIQQATQDLLTFRPEMTEPEGTLEKEKKLVSMAKKIAPSRRRSGCAKVHGKARESAGDHCHDLGYHHRDLCHGIRPAPHAQEGSEGG